MSEFDVINERLQRGDERFAEVTEALSRITTHLQSQDATMADVVDKLDKVANGTDAMITMWNGGVKTVRFFCRLAEAWTFLLRKVFIPVVLPLAGLWTLIRIVHHEALPEWVNAGIKLILAVL